MDCNPPGSSVHGILQARILEWVATPFSRGSFGPSDWTWVLLQHCRQILYEPPGKPGHTGKEDSVSAFPASLAAKYGYLTWGCSMVHKQTSTRTFWGNFCFSKWYRITYFVPLLYPFLLPSVQVWRLESEQPLCPSEGTIKGRSRELHCCWPWPG